MRPGSQGNGAASLWDAFDEETIRRALLAALGEGKTSGKRKKKGGATA